MLSFFFSCFLSLLAFCSEEPYQKFSLPASVPRTEIIYMDSYKWRSIALILIMHQDDCNTRMDIK